MIGSILEGKLQPALAHAITEGTCPSLVAADDGHPFGTGTIAAGAHMKAAGGCMVLGLNGASTDVILASLLFHLN